MNLTHYRNRCETMLQTLLPPQGTRIADAMRYSTLGGGKRLRATLAYSIAADFALTETDTDHAACALECLHAYSLIHDDLPAMDDDDLRRGKPSNHKAFDQATAILAGDALNTLSFELLSQSPHPAEIRLLQIRTLSRAAGWQGMVGGQMLDMCLTGQHTDLATLQNIHRKKTGALIQAALLLGAQPAPQYLQHEHTLKHIGECLGIIYQITDDLLDGSADSRTLGKTAGKDSAQGKNTYLSHLGKTRSLAHIERYRQDICRHCATLPNTGAHLNRLIEHIINRDH